MTGGSDGDDRLTGGSGTDIAVYGVLSTLDGSGTEARSVRVDLTTGAATGVGTDALVGVEGAIGGAGDDVMIGDVGPNVFSVGDLGLVGKEVIDGGGGADTLTWVTPTRSWGVAARTLS